jgi:DnaJ-class molecular chaperone
MVGIVDSQKVRCAFCGGQGTDPFGIMSWLSTCCVCGGRGVVRVRVPHRPCNHCRGSGAIKTFTCTVCGGKGLVPAPVGPSARCPECRGTGDDAGAPALACLACRGQGWVAGIAPVRIKKEAQPGGRAVSGGEAGAPPGCR